MAPQATNPLFVEPGAGQMVRFLGETITFKIRSEQAGNAFAMAENVVAGHRGPPLHTHGGRDECLYILEGEFEFRCGPRRWIGTAGSTIRLPRNVPHRFENRLDTPGRLLGYVVPGGYEGFLEALSRLPPEQQLDIDYVLPLARKHDYRVVDPSSMPSADADADTPAGAVFVQAGAGPVLNVVGDFVTLKVRSQDSSGTLSLFEDKAPAYGGPPLHQHHREDEVFYVLEGEYEFRCGQQRFLAGPGSVVLAPRGLPHTFANQRSRASKLLIATFPGGLDRFFEECDRLSQAGQASPQQVADLGRQYDVQFLTTAKA